MVSATAIAVILLIAKPVYSFSGLLAVLLGIPVYYAWRMQGAGQESSTNE